MKDYKFLKIAGIIFKVLAWLSVALGLVAGIMVIITGGGAPATLANGTVVPPPPKAAGLIFMALGALYFLILFTLSEIISLLLDLKGSCAKSVV